SKVRADLLVVEQGLAETRSRAQALILAGAVIAGESQKIAKAGELLPPETVLRLKNEVLPFVSRGGIKLAAALDQFAISPNEQICLDVGASTGGFTDCLLQRGAQKVYAVDVGHNQLAWSLRQDPRVVVLERVHIKDLKRQQVPEDCQLVVMDL